MRTRSEMIEDAHIARSGAASMTPAEWETYKKAVDADAALSDRFQRAIVVNTGTIVYVADKSRDMIPHKLKKDHVFLTHLIGSTPELGTLSNTPKIPNYTTPEKLLKSGYYTFETNNRDWPYMVVPRDKIRTDKIEGIRTDFMMFDEFATTDDSA